MRKYFDTVFYVNSLPVGGAKVRVTDSLGTVVQLYSDNGVTPISNPVTADQTGFYSFYVADGSYTLQYFTGNFLLRTLTDVQIYDETGIGALINGIGNQTDPTKGGALVGFDGGTVADFFKNKNNRIVDSISALRSVSKSTYTRVFVTGYYSVGDGGGGGYYYDSVDTTTPDNGGSVIVASDGARWKLEKTSTSISVRQFGAKGDGATDDTASISSASTYCSSIGSLLWFPDGTYASVGVVVSCAVNMSTMARLLYIGPDNGTLLDLSGSNLSHGTVRVDGNAKNVLTVTISGSSNEFQAIYAENVTASATSSLSIVAIRAFGDSNKIAYSRVRNMVNTGQPNVSFPQGILAYGSNTVLNQVLFENCRSGLVLSTNVTTHVGEIIARNMQDNGIYQLAGQLILGRLEYAGVEEPIVFEGTADVGEVSIVGFASGIGFQNCGDVSIGRLSVVPDLSGNTVGFLWRIRQGTSCGRLHFGEVTGKFKGSTLFSSNIGTVEYLTIAKMDVKFLYDAAVCTSPGSFGDLTACSGVRLENMLITLIDVNNVGGTTAFNITLGTLNKRSTTSRIDFQTYASDGVTESTLGIRGVNFAQTQMDTYGVHWRMDIGPYIVNSSLNSSLADTANATPTAGFWNRGKTFYTAFPSASGQLGIVCVASGTPGTWKSMGTIGA